MMKISFFWMSVLVFTTLFSQAARPAMAQPNLVIGENGKTDYVIYHEANAPSSIRDAARDLKSYFQKSAGFAPETVASQTPPLAPFISLGSTPALRVAGLDAAKIADDGFRIAARGRNIFIFGQDTSEGAVTAQGGVFNGTANGVNDFCETVLGVRWLLPGDLGEEISAKNALALPADLDRAEVPQFNYRVLPYIGASAAISSSEKRLKGVRKQQVARAARP